MTATVTGGTAALTTGAIGADDLDAATARLDEHLTAPGVVTLYATLFQAWGSASG